MSGRMVASSSEAEGGEGIGEAAPRRTGWLAAGGILGALLASSCCVVPLVLFTAGIGGAWVGNLAALTPYQPFFLAFAAVSLGGGLVLAYRRPKGAACRSACDRRTRRVRGFLWAGVGLAVVAGGFPYIAPMLLGV